ncbi:MAG TPA: quinone oxidoreductase [Candidatus Acidoferrales bacterium]|nr:quinone oxidoreductase [Candidatus Acidoferrales bacterium]
MEAILVRSAGGPEVMEVADLPKPIPKKGEALVRITAIGVNFRDVYVRMGLYPIKPPYTPGSEGAGVVEALGPETQADVAPGDRVAWAGSNEGSYAPYNVVETDKLVKIPQGVDDKLAAAAMLQGMTAHYLSHGTYPVQPGDAVLIHAGAGGVGLLLTQMCKSRGARAITTVSTADKAALSRKAGADDVINYVEQDFQAEVKRLTGGTGVECVYDSVGKTTFEGSLNSLRVRGYMVLFGTSSGGISPIDPSIFGPKGSLFFTRPTLVHYTRTKAETTMRATEVFNQIQSGALKVRIGHEYPLREAQQAHRDLEARKTTGKVLLLP